MFEIFFPWSVSSLLLTAAYHFIVCIYCIYLLIKITHWTPQIHLTLYFHEWNYNIHEHVPTQILASYLEKQIHQWDCHTYDDFPELLCNLYHHQQCKNLHYTISSPILGIICLSNCWHSNTYKMILYCCFNLHFTSLQWTLATLHIFAIYSNIISELPVYPLMNFFELFS